MLTSDVLDYVKNVKQEKDMIEDFNCLGRIDQAYPSLPTDVLDNYYRTWIWENDKGVRIAIWDEGNGWCHFLCEGTEEAILQHVTLEATNQ